MQENILTKKLVILLIFYLSLVVAFFCVLPFHNELLSDPTARLQFHDDMINVESTANARYRILPFVLTEIVVRVLTKFLPYSYSLFLSYSAFYVIGIFLTLFLFFIYLSYWFNKEYSLIGVLFASISIIFAQRIFFTPYDIPEVMFFILSLILIKKKKYLLLGITIFFASLNRETALFLPFLFLFCSLDFKNLKKSFKKCFPIFLIYFMIYVIIFLCLRGILGFAPMDITLSENFILKTGTGAIIYGIIYLSLFLGWFWIFAIKGLKYAPSFVRKSSLIILFSLPFVIIMGSWQEVRVIMFWIPIIIPLGLFYIFNRKRKFKNHEKIKTKN